MNSHGGKRERDDKWTDGETPKRPRGLSSHSTDTVEPVAFAEPLENEPVSVAGGIPPQLLENGPVSAAEAGIPTLRVTINSERDNYAIERFKSSLKPFFAFICVTIILQLGIVVLEPRSLVPVLCSVAVRAAVAAVRWYLEGFGDPGRVRWLFGWVYVAGEAFVDVVALFTLPETMRANPIVLIILMVIAITTHMFLNIISIPCPCRINAVIMGATLFYMLPDHWSSYEDGRSTTGIIAGMVIGETFGRIWVQNDREVNPAEEEAANQRFQSSFKPFVFFNFIAICCHLTFAAFNPPLDLPVALCISSHVLMASSLWYLQTNFDLSRARWLFGWGWAIMPTCCIGVFGFADPEYISTLKLDMSATALWGGLSLLMFVYQNVVGTPWLARGTMLCAVCVLVVYSAVCTAQVAIGLVGPMLVGELIGNLLVQFLNNTDRTQGCCCFQNACSSFFNWWSLAFKDKEKETAYVAKHFEESYASMTTFCVIAIVLLAGAAASFPTSVVYLLKALPLWMGVLLARVYTEHTAPPDSKNTHFGFALIVVSLLSVVLEVAANWLHPPMQDVPPFVVAVFAFCLALVVIIGKLACLPEQYRQAIHFILLTGRIAVSTSAVGLVTEIFTYVATVPVAELVAYALDHQRRLIYRKTNRVKDKEKQIKLALDANLSPSCITDVHMNVKYINPALISMFGYSEQELVGQHIEILMKASLSKRQDITKEFLGTDGREVEIRHKDGHAMHVRLACNIMADRDLFLASFLDITAEKDRLKLERNMHLALETTFSPIAMADSQMKLTYVNEATCTIFGYTSRELVGKDIGILMDEETRKKHRALVESFANGDPIRIFGHEFQAKHKHGHTLYLRLSVNIADDGKLLVASFQDMSLEMARRVTKRKLKQYSLLKSLFTSIPGTIVFEVSNPGPNQKVECVEGVTQTFIGFAHDDWKGMQCPVTSVVSPAAKSAAEEAVDALRKGKPIPLSDLEATHRDGHTVWLRLGKASRRLANGNELLVIHDVTADVYLRELRATMATFQNLPGFILVTTDMVSHLAVDGDVFGVTGYTAEEFVALDPRRDFLSPRADRDQVMTSFGSITDSAKSFNEIVIQHVHKDGHTLHLRLCHGSRVIGTAPNGKPKILAVFRDVTETVVAQREAVAARDALMRRMKFVPAMVYEMVTHGTNGKRFFKYVSTECVSIYGLTHREMTSSRAWMDMLHPDDVALYENSFAKSMANLLNWDLEFRVIVGGKTKYLHGRAAPRREGGTVVWTGVLQDVTVNHNLREMTKKRDIQKAIAERFKSACAYLSHEIRNQLYPQSVVLEEMKDEGVSEWMESINMILNANATVTTILNRVLDLAKWESGEFPVDNTLFSIYGLFKTIAVFAEAKGALVAGLESVQRTWFVRADEHLLKQAATNLASNASKFGQNRPVNVTLSFTQSTHDKGVIVITVSDTGRGMTPEQLTKAMVPFGQIRKPGELRSGTGLGLPLTKAMIEVGHKGTLTVCSEGLGKGTQATIRVPVLWVDRREPPPQEADPLWWVELQPGATADILVVDDVKLNRMVTTFSAKKLGLTFHEASDGAEAVERMRNNKYSLVFMDHQMPGMNGATAIDKARANGYTLPIVMTSGNTFEPCEEAELKRRGVTAFLSKLAVPGTRHAMKRLHEIKQKRSKV